MKVFLDANILVATIQGEYPIFIYTTWIINQPGKYMQLITSSVCIAIAYYFAMKRFGKADAKKRVAELAKFMEACHSGPEEVANTFSNKKILDVEDGIQYYSALKEGCTCIITEDLTDFYFSEIEILDSLAFLNKYLNFQ